MGTYTYTVYTEHKKKQDFSVEYTILCCSFLSFRISFKTSSGGSEREKESVQIQSYTTLSLSLPSSPSPRYIVAEKAANFPKAQGHGPLPPRILPARHVVDAKIINIGLVQLQWRSQEWASQGQARPVEKSGLLYTPFCSQIGVKTDLHVALVCTHVYTSCIEAWRPSPFICLTTLNYLATPL